MTTLKISDLSVGDWVMNYKGFPTKVQVIVSEGHILCGEMDAKSEHCSRLWVQDIRPIPITAEILEKNGFKKYSEREWGCNDDSLYHTFIHIDTPDEKMWFISFPTIFNLTWDHPIYNIHELQHLIRLAGVDKEINL